MIEPQPNAFGLLGDADAAGGRWVTTREVECAWAEKEALLAQEAAQVQARRQAGDACADRWAPLLLRLRALGVSVPIRHAEPAIRVLLTLEQTEVLVTALERRTP